MNQVLDRVPVVARTRLTPPPAHRDEIPREALLATLADQRSQVTLIAAPHGSGKSVALAQWARSRRDRSAWVSLTGAHHGCVVAVWSAILEALPLARPELVWPTMPGAVEPRQVVDRLIPELLNTFGHADELTLILDGLDQIVDPCAQESLSQFLLQLPGQVRVLLSTSRPAWGSLSLLRAAGRLDEVSAEALRFTVAEAHTLFARAPGRVWGPESVESLHARLDGWAVGLCLASGRAPEQDPREVPEVVLDYVRAAVLDRASVQERDALMRTSVLSELRWETVAKVAGCHSAAGLMSFAESSLLLRRVPDGWAFHPALRAAAASDLRRVDPELGTTLRARAAHHLVAAWPAADPEELLALLAQLGPQVSARIAGAGSAASLACGSPARAAELLTSVTDLTVARAVRAQVCLQSGDLAGAAAERESQERCRPAGADAWAAVLLDVAVSALELWNGRPAEGLRQLEDAAEAAARMGYTDARLRALDLLVACAHLTGNSERAQDAAREAVQIYRGRHLRGVAPVIAMSYLDTNGGLQAPEDAVPALPADAPVHGPHHSAFAAYLRATALRRSGDCVGYRRAQSEARSVLLPEAAGPLLRSLLDDVPGAVAGQPGHLLTDREVVVLRAMTGPLTLREIARELHVSHNTIKSQVSSLFRKLEVHDRVGALRAARDRGLVLR